MVQKIQEDWFALYGVRVEILRLDCMHSEVGGNKYYKLKYNLKAAISQKAKQVITFGGAYSNHLWAFGEVMSKHPKIKAIALVRGEMVLPLNPVLQSIAEKGVHLKFIDRETYRQKNTPAFLESLQKKYGDFYLIPEGGSNEEGVLGCREIAKEYADEYSHICAPVGSGGTLSGLILEYAATHQIVGYPALKNASFLFEDIQSLIEKAAHRYKWDVPSTDAWTLRVDYGFGGFAKSTPELLQFIASFYKRHHVPLDETYMGKMMYGVYKDIEQGYYPAGSNILLIHTGRSPI